MRIGPEGFPKRVSTLRVSTSCRSASLYTPVPPITASAIALIRSILQRVDARQVAALLVVVHAEAEYVAVGHFQANIIGTDAGDGACVLFGGQCGDAHVGSTLLHAPSTHRSQGV